MVPADLPRPEWVFGHPVDVQPPDHHHPLRTALLPGRRNGCTPRRPMDSVVRPMERPRCRQPGRHGRLRVVLGEHGAAHRKLEGDLFGEWVHRHPHGGRPSRLLRPAALGVVLAGSSRDPACRAHGRNLERRRSRTSHRSRRRLELVAGIRRCRRARLDLVESRWLRRHRPGRS